MPEAYDEPLQVEPAPEPGRLTASRPQAYPDWMIWIALVFSVLAVYAQVRHFQFIHADDDLYLVLNPHVQAGLTPASIRWSLTAVTSNNWLPVTLLSYMLDVQLFGLQSGMIHLMNVALHALACVLLFQVLQRATRARWPSAYVAFVFALHPLHVESVAWISERKDILCAVFWFLTLYAYLRYTEQPSLGRYLAVVAPFCLGLMSKPMAVALPFTLLLLDYWPLRRLRGMKVVWEKLPLFALSAATSVVTYWAQASTGAVQGLPLATRIMHAPISYIIYIGQTFWPARLAIFYPYPERTPAWQRVGAVALILAVTTAALLTRRTRPYLVVGWFWYLATLLPVIGLVQAGMQSHADRYTYIPMIGLGIMLAWGAADVARMRPRAKPTIAVAAAVSCALCMVLAWRQAAAWRSFGSVFQHALDVAPDNYVAECNLAVNLVETTHRCPEAMEHLEAALRIKPDYAPAHISLGVCLAAASLWDAAISHLEAAIRYQPNSTQAYERLGYCLMKAGRYGEAIPHLEHALRLDPKTTEAHFNLAECLSKMPGREPEAIAQYQAALRLKPAYAEAYYGWGKLLASLGRTQEAIVQLQAGQAIREDDGITELIDRLKVKGADQRQPRSDKP